MTSVGILLIGGIVTCFGTSAVSLIRTHRIDRNVTMIMEGLGNGLGHLDSKLEGVAQIPQILHDLNLGGVQLMPQKTLGEVVAEKVMSAIFGQGAENKTIDGNNAAEAWPDEKQSPEGGQSSPELTSQTSDEPPIKRTQC